MKDLVVILSYWKDRTAIEVMELLQRRHIPVLLLDTGDFPVRLRLQTSLVESQWQGWLTSNDGSRYALEDIKSIFYRRPTHFQVSEDLPERVQVFCENEATKGFGGILRSLDCVWISHIDAIKAASYKPRQLRLASQLGMRTPRTLITNDPEALAAFYDQCHEAVICKTLYGGNISVEKGVWDAIYTSRVTREDLRQKERVSYTAHLFQEEIPKAFEIRATVVGRHVFASTVEGEPVVDFRTSYNTRTYRAYSLPPGVEAFCRELVRQLHLAFGAIDMAVTPEGEYVFFEINPVGQYQWIEVATGLPINEAVADALVEGEAYDDR